MKDQNYNAYSVQRWAGIEYVELREANGLSPRDAANKAISLRDEMMREGLTLRMICCCGLDNPFATSLARQVLINAAVKCRAHYEFRRKRGPKKVTQCMEVAA